MLFHVSFKSENLDLFLSPAGELPNPQTKMLCWVQIKVPFLMLCGAPVLDLGPHFVAINAITYALKYLCFPGKAIRWLASGPTRHEYFSVSCSNICICNWGEFSFPFSRNQKTD